MGQGRESFGRAVVLRVCRVPPRRLRIDIQGTTWCDVAVYMISELLTECGIGSQGPIGPGHGIVHTRSIRIHIGQGGFRVPGIELEAVASLTIPSCVPVSMRPITVAHVEVHDHVIDHVVHVQEVFVVRIARAIGVVALEFLVHGVVRDILIQHGQHAVPRVIIAVRGGILVKGIPGVLDAAVIGRRKRGIRPLHGVVQAPVEPIDVQVHKDTVRRDMAHVAHRVHGKGIANVEGI